MFSCTLYIICWDSDSLTDFYRQPIISQFSSEFAWNNRRLNLMPKGCDNGGEIYANAHRRRGSLLPHPFDTSRWKQIDQRHEIGRHRRQWRRLDEKHIAKTSNYHWRSFAASGAERKDVDEWKSKMDLKRYLTLTTLSYKCTECGESWAKVLKLNKGHQTTMKFR